MEDGQAETIAAWRSLFENWPETIPREGIVVTRFQESIPFVSFLISGSIVLLERDRPDGSGARKVMLAYDSISALKITSPIEMARFQVMGFQPPM